MHEDSLAKYLISLSSGLLEFCYSNTSCVYLHHSYIYLSIIAIASYSTEELYSLKILEAACI